MQADSNTTRHAACSCGQLQVTCVGEPVRIASCHCIECQRRTGGVFATQARFMRGQVTTTGSVTKFTRSSDSGRSVTFNFCPTCGSTAFWEIEGFPDVIAVAVGAFADPTFPAPRHSVWERTRHPWVERMADLPMEHLE
jgi:hypothetical protein